MPYADVTQKDKIGFPMVHLEVDFMKPLAYGDTARVAVRPTKLGRTSVHFAYEVTSKLKAVLTTRAKATTVVVDLDTFEPMAVPVKYRALLEDAIHKAERGG